MDTPPDVNALYAMVRALDEKFTLLLASSEKLNRTRFQAAEGAVSAALSSSEKAISKAEMANDKRFESVNEFRAALGDQASTLLTRNEYNTEHRALEEKVDRCLGMLG